MAWRSFLLIVICGINNAEINNSLIDVLHGSLAKYSYSTGYENRFCKEQLYEVRYKYGAIDVGIVQVVDSVGAS